MKYDKVYLRKRPQYDEMINEIELKQPKIKYPNRVAQFMRNTPQLSQFDGDYLFLTIEEQESEPMGIPIPEPTTRSIPITPIEPSKVTVQKEEQKDEQKDDVKPDAFADFMNKIPMKSETTAKRSPKNTQAKIKASEQPLKSGITLESVINTVLTNNVANAVIKPENQGSSGKEELKPIGKYNLGELQHLAKVYKINTQKDGKAGKMINKTKEELYNEIKEKQ